MSQLASVAVPVPLLTTFFYRVPAGMARRLEPGARVRVRFGPRRLTGVVFEIGAEAEMMQRPDAPPANRIRDIEAILDPAAPALAPEILELVRWSADYYLEPPGELARAALPPGGTKQRFTAPATVRIARAAPEGAGDASKLVGAPARAAVYEAICDAGEAGAAVPELGARFKGAATKVRDLEAAGLVVISEVAKIGRPEHRPQDGAREAVLTPAQTDALKAIEAAVDTGDFEPFLLHGVTGSGKTELYLRAGQHALAKGRGVLLLVPEIGLTPRLTAQVVGRYGERVAVLHSGLTGAQRAEAWDRVRRGEAQVVVGARSAIFAPVPNLGLLVVDEEHDGAFKQGSTPHYNARDLALVRGMKAGATVVLGSATPALETWHNAQTGKLKYLALPERVAERPMPKVEIVDLREFMGAGPDGLPLLTPTLCDALAETVRKGEQAILFLNRRGFATFVVCRKCSRSWKCEHCEVSLTYHRRADVLRCHYCGQHSAVPKSCPDCGNQIVSLMGRGTERIEAAVEDALEAAGLGRHGVARVDRDTTQQRGSLEALLHRFALGELRVLVGTQMIAKGHDFPNVTLVGVISADSGLGLPDFRAGERTYQLISQVSGRAGRGERPGRVLLQTMDPEQACINLAMKNDYAGFAKGELEARQLLGYPPWQRLVGVLVHGEDAKETEDIAKKLGQAVRSGIGDDSSLRLLGPVPAPIARVRGRWRWRLLLKGGNHLRLKAVAKQALGAVEAPRKVAVVVDVDPVDLL